MILQLTLAKILLILNSVSSSVIPTKSQLLSKVQMQRVKRDTSSWAPICPTDVETMPVVPHTDSFGNQILRLANSGNLEYLEYVKVTRCRDTEVHVGGVTVRCEQEYLEHKLIVYDPDTGQENYQHPYFFPSGCSAQVLKPSWMNGWWNAVKCEQRTSKDVERDNMTESSLRS